MEFMLEGDGHRHELTLNTRCTGDKVGMHDRQTVGARFRKESKRLECGNKRNVVAKIAQLLAQVVEIGAPIGSREVNLALLSLGCFASALTPRCLCTLTLEFGCECGDFCAMLRVDATIVLEKFDNYVFKFTTDGRNRIESKDSAGSRDLVSLKTKTLESISP